MSVTLLVHGSHSEFREFKKIKEDKESTDMQLIDDKLEYSQINRN